MLRRSKYSFAKAMECKAGCGHAKRGKLRWLAHHAGREGRLRCRQDSQKNIRGVAQLASALAWGARGRLFESDHPDN